MLALAKTIDGAFDPDPGRTNPVLENCLLLPQAQLMIAGTACMRPFYADDARQLAEETGHDLLLIRFDAYEIEVDVWLSHLRQWLCRCRLLSTDNGLALVGPGPLSPVIRVSSRGLLILGWQNTTSAVSTKVGGY